MDESQGWHDMRFRENCDVMKRHMVDFLARRSDERLLPPQRSTDQRALREQ